MWDKKNIHLFLQIFNEDNQVVKIPNRHEILEIWSYFCYDEICSWVEPILNSEDKVTCSRTQHSAPKEIQTNNP